SGRLGLCGQECLASCVSDGGNGSQAGDAGGYQCLNLRKRHLDRTRIEYRLIDALCRRRYKSSSSRRGTASETERKRHAAGDYGLADHVAAPAGCALRTPSIASTTAMIAPWILSAGRS